MSRKGACDKRVGRFVEVGPHRRRTASAGDHPPGPSTPEGFRPIAQGCPPRGLPWVPTSTPYQPHRGLRQNNDRPAERCRSTWRGFREGEAPAEPRRFANAFPPSPHTGGNGLRHDGSPSGGDRGPPPPTRLGWSLALPWDRNEKALADFGEGFLFVIPGKGRLRCEDYFFSNSASMTLSSFGPAPASGPGAPPGAAPPAP